MRATRAAVGGWLLITACQTPFGEDRHLLVDDRVVAVEIETPSSDTWVPRVWTLQEGRPWTDAPATFQWYWLDPDDSDVDAVLDTRVPDGAGPRPALAVPDPGGANALGLITTFPDGTERRARLVLDEPPRPLPDLGPITLARVVDQPLDEATEEDLLLDVRRERKATPDTHVASGAWARLGTSLEGDDARFTRLRWMATAGDFLELEPLVTDWASADLTLDGLDVEAVEPLDRGPVTVVALALDDVGGQRVRAQEIWVGAPEAGVVVSGRWLAADVEAAPGTLVEATLAADDDAPTGLRLVDAAVTTSPSVGPDDPWGTAGLPCRVAVDGAFEPDWLFDQRCLRRDVVGARVVVVSE